MVANTWYNLEKVFVELRLRRVDMCKTVINENVKATLDIPKAFWKYYDLYRREAISLEEFSIRSNLSKEEIIHYLSVI